MDARPPRSLRPPLADLTAGAWRGSEDRVKACENRRGKGGKSEGTGTQALSVLPPPAAPGPHSRLGAAPAPPPPCLRCPTPTPSDARALPREPGPAAPILALLLAPPNPRVDARTLSPAQVTLPPARHPRAAPPWTPSALLSCPPPFPCLPPRTWVCSPHSASHPGRPQRRPQLFPGPGAKLPKQCKVRAGPRGPRYPAAPRSAQGRGAQLARSWRMERLRE